jgi:hypothetical protein
MGPFLEFEYVFVDTQCVMLKNKFSTIGYNHKRELAVITSAVKS